MDTSPPQRWLAFPRALWLSLLAALAVGLTPLGVGFATDDSVHLLILEGKPGVGSPFDLFRFAGGDREALWRLTQEGTYPWWALS